MHSVPHSSETGHRNELAALLAPQLAEVNACLLEKMYSTAPLISQIAGYLISLGGKRLRPLLTLATAELCGYGGRRHIQLAACVEFMHTATLLHDDVVDKSFLRRGMPSANTRWGNKASVLAGDFLFSRAFELMVEDGSLAVLQILSNAASTIVEGEMMQLKASHTLELDEAAYLRIIESKTACLFSAAATVGAVVAGASLSQREHLGEFGRLLGLAFQVMDDLLDYTADQEQLGKPVGDDFRGGRVTLPLIFAYHQGIEPSFWEEAVKGKKNDQEALSRAIHLLKESGALAKTRQTAEGFVREALAHLIVFPDSLLQRALQDMAHFSVWRTN